MENTQFFTERRDYFEETLFSFNLIPIHDQPDDADTTLDFYNTAFQTTRQKIWEQTTSTLLSTATAPNMDLYWQEVLEGFKSNDLDIPLAVMYSLDRAKSERSPRSTVHFQGALGTTQDRPLAIKRANLDESDEPLAQLLNKARTADGPMVFAQGDGAIPQGLLVGQAWRGFGEPSNVLVVLPLVAGKEIAGFLLLGLSPRRAQDDGYDGFTQLLSGQLSTSLTTAVLMDQAKRKQVELSKDVAESESRFKAFPEPNSAGKIHLI